MPTSSNNDAPTVAAPAPASPKAPDQREQGRHIEDRDRDANPDRRPRPAGGDQHRLERQGPDLDGDGGDQPGQHAGGGVEPRPHDQRAAAARPNSTTAPAITVATTPPASPTCRASRHRPLQVAGRLQAGELGIEGRRPPAWPAGRWRWRPGGRCGTARPAPARASAPTIRVPVWVKACSRLALTLVAQTKRHRPGKPRVSGPGPAPHRVPLAAPARARRRRPASGRPPPCRRTRRPGSPPTPPPSASTSGAAQRPARPRRPCSGRPALSNRPNSRSTPVAVAETMKMVDGQVEPCRRRGPRRASPAGRRPAPPPRKPMVSAADGADQVEHQAEAQDPVEVVAPAFRQRPGAVVQHGLPRLELHQLCRPSGRRR